MKSSFYFTIGGVMAEQKDVLSDLLSEELLSLIPMDDKGE